MLGTVHAGRAGQQRRKPSATVDSSKRGRAAARKLTGLVQDRLVSATLAFYAEHGHLRVPIREAVDEVLLGGFLARCRKAFAAGKLNLTIANWLDSIDPQWRAGSGGLHRHRHMLRAAHDYFATNGNLRVPKAYVAADGVGLGWWLSDRRNQHRAGTLSPVLGEALKGIDPAWAAIQQHGLSRSERYTQRILKALNDYAKQHGHAQVPVRYTTGRWLGPWSVAPETPPRAA